MHQKNKNLHCTEEQNSHFKKIVAGEDLAIFLREKYRDNETLSTVLPYITDADVDATQLSERVSHIPLDQLWQLAQVVIEYTKEVAEAGNTIAGDWVEARSLVLAQALSLVEKNSQEQPQGTAQMKEEFQKTREEVAELLN